MAMDQAKAIAALTINTHAMLSLLSEGPDAIILVPVYTGEKVVRPSMVSRDGVVADNVLPAAMTALAEAIGDMVKYTSAKAAEKKVSDGPEAQAAEAQKEEVCGQ